MEWIWITLIMFGVWILLGLIALGLAYILLREEEDKIPFWNNFFIIGLGFMSLIFVIEDIDEKFPFM